MDRRHCILGGENNIRLCEEQVNSDVSFGGRVPDVCVEIAGDLTTDSSFRVRKVEYTVVSWNTCMRTTLVCGRNGVRERQKIPSAGTYASKSP